MVRSLGQTLSISALCLLPFAGRLHAQPGNLSVLSVTSQQALVQYNAPDTNACTLAVTDNSGFGVTVWDVNPGTFANSDQDLGRANTITWDGGLSRGVVIGKRSAEAGVDGKLYSRSLQQNTDHTLTVTCDGAALSIDFTTLIPPIGATNPDPPAFNPAGFGNADWPNVNWGSSATTENSTPYIDPKTGILLKPASWFGQLLYEATGNTFNTYYDSAGTWTNARNIISGSSGSLASSSNTSPIFVALPPNPTGTGDGPYWYGSNWVGYSLTDLRVNFIGNGNDSGGLVVDFCLTADSGQTCISAIQSVTLPLTTTGTVAFPSGTFPAPPFTNWSMITWPQHNLVVPTTASVTTSGGLGEDRRGKPRPTGSSVTNLTSVPAATGLFPTNLAAGSKVLVAGSPCAHLLCTVASVPNASTMTLLENVGTSSTAVTLANFGLKIWKANATGTINLTTTFDVGYEGVPGFSIADGASEQCAQNPTTLTQNAEGTTVPPYSALMCTLEWSDGTVVYAFVPSTGEMRPIALMYNLYGSGLGNNNGPKPGTDPFGSDGRTIYAQGYQQDTGYPEIIKWVYRGQGKTYVTGGLVTNHSFIPYYSPPNGQSASDVTCNVGEQTAGNLCTSPITGTTKSNDLRTQVAAASANYSKGAFGTNPNTVGLVGNIVEQVWQDSQDSIALFSYVDVTTGLLTGVRDTLWTDPNARWGCTHTSFGWPAGGKYTSASQIPCGSHGGQAFGGPYQSNVTYVCASVDGSGNCTKWNTNTAITTSTALTCPSSVCGSTVTGALLLRIAGQPCSASTNTTESTNYPCPWNASYGMLSPLQVGDYLWNLAVAGEAFKILAIIPNTSTDIAIWVQRGFGQDGTCLPYVGTCRNSFPNGWSASTFPSYACDVAVWYLDATNPTAPIQSEYCGAISGHGDFGPGPSGTYVADENSKLAKYGSAVPGGFLSPSYTVGGFGVWAGKQPSADFLGNGSVETYPSLRVYTNPPPVWAADWRAYQGGAAPGGGAGTGLTSATFTAITAGGRTHVWKIATGYTPNPKVLPLESWAGRFIYQDISGPSSSITDSTNQSYCVVYAAGECVPGSSVGDIYFSDSAAIITGSCYTNHMDASLPCLLNASPVGTWAVQQDLSQNNPQGSLLRRLTMAFTAPSRQYTYTNWRPTPDGSWGFMLNQYADGVFPIMWMAKLPPWQGYDTVRRDDFIQLPIFLGTGADLAEIRFGYEENGAYNQFYCTTRAEACASGGTPFSYISSDGHAGTSCANGCTIAIPALPGRVLWWQEFRSSDGGATWSAPGQPDVLAAP